MSGRDGTVKLTAATVFGDGAKDRLTGGAGQDWFFSDGEDKLTDWHVPEIVTPLNIDFGSSGQTCDEDSHKGNEGDQFQDFAEDYRDYRDKGGSGEHKPIALSLKEEDFNFCGQAFGNSKLTTCSSWVQPFVEDIASLEDNPNPNDKIQIVLPVAESVSKGNGSKKS